jgi:hypothetical protein
MAAVFLQVRQEHCLLAILVKNYPRQGGTVLLK